MTEERPLPPKFERYGNPTAVLDTREAAAYLGITRELVYRLVRVGKLPHTRIGQTIRIRLVDLDAFLEEHTSRTWRPGPQGRPRGTRSASSTGTA